MLRGRHARTASAEERHCTENHAKASLLMRELGRTQHKVETFATLPKEASADWQKRTYFNTRAFGKSAAGHDFPEQLTDQEARAVLEYLKTL